MDKNQDKSGVYAATLTEGPGSSPARPDMERLCAGMRLGQYQRIRELGRGGMGTVYLARDIRLGRRVAVKFLTRNDPSLAERFKGEARMTARCKHDNIVDIYDAGEDPGYSYMVLEYVQGMTLREWLQDRWQSSTSGDRDGPNDAAQTTVKITRVSPSLAVELITPVVRALAYAHGLGLVHRDLKPENIMLAEDGSIKVLDFGLAMVLDHASEVRYSSMAALEEMVEHSTERDFKTQKGAVMGTMRYMSPEQWVAGDVDARTDLWAIGIILWELCTGSHPLAPLSRERLLSIRDVAVPMPLLDEKHPRLGPLAQIVDRCLRKHAAERIRSARVLLEEIEPLLPGRTWQAGKDDPDNPYVGLAAFQCADAARFFGRDQDIASLTAQLRNHRLVAVAGPSGASNGLHARCSPAWYPRSARAP